MCNTAGMHTFLRYLGDISKFYAPEGWHGAISVLRTQKIGHHRKKMVAVATLRPGFVQPCNVVL